MKFILSAVFIIFSIFKTNCNLIPHEGDLVPSSPPEFDLDLSVEPYYRW